AGGTRMVSAQESTEPPRAALAVWDTGTPSAEPLASEAIAHKTGWKRIAGNDTTSPFQGDAAISNGCILAIARQQGTGLELYSLRAGQPVFRARLLLTPSRGTEQVTLTENSRTAVGLEITSKAGSARFRLKRGELFVESQAVAEAATLRIECPSRFA